MAYLRVSFILFALVVAAMIGEGIFADEKSCGANEMYNECGTECQRTCADLGTSGKLCNHMCAVGCFCADGHVRKNDENSACVKETEC